MKQVVGNCPRCGMPIYDEFKYASHPYFDGKPVKSCLCLPLQDAITWHYAPPYVPPTTTVPWPIHPWQSPFWTINKDGTMASPAMPPSHTASATGRTTP